MVGEWRDKIPLKIQLPSLESCAKMLAFAREGTPKDWNKTMFGIANGFDILLGNPPYVRQESIGPHKSSLLALYRDAATARSDLYCYFYARGLQLLRDGGMHVFVCSNSWLDVGYGAKLQEHLLKNAHVQAIYESAVGRQFSTADINTIISVIRKTTANDGATRFVHLLESFEAAVAEGGQRREIAKSRAELIEAATNPPKQKIHRRQVGRQIPARSGHLPPHLG